jgi:hypothetical protein
MKRKAAAIVFIVIIGIIYSCGTKPSIPIDTYPFTESTEPTRAEQVMRALIEAYPNQIKEVEFRNDDWAALLGDTWFYYAGGRLLPENQLANAVNFRTYQFYNYPAELPSWTAPSPEQITRFSTWTTTRSQNTIRRSNYFLDALWQASNRVETENMLERITFLGKQTRVHQFLLENLDRVETQILDAAKTDPEVQEWINSINTLEGYGWRNIADTQSRSYHSYGIAIDILPRLLDGRQTYWLWTSHHRADWWNVSYNERYHPPQAVIHAFEVNGFIWGGKWPLFDTMHFEYRPEILILNGMPPQR